MSRRERMAVAHERDMCVCAALTEKKLVAVAAVVDFK